MTPVFSVVIPCYNAADYIIETLESVFNQTFDNFEVIVINDGSTDKSIEVLQEIHDPRLRVVSIQNSGVSVARNVGIKLAAGIYVAFLDADDIWNINHLHHAYQTLKSVRNVNWYTSTCKFDAYVSDSWKNSSPHPHVKIVDYFTNRSARATSASSTVIRKDILVKSNLFPENIKLAEDTLAWATYAIISPIIAVNTTPTVLYRQHELSTSKSRMKTLTKDVEIFNSLMSHLHKLSLDYPHNQSLKKYFFEQFSGYFRLLAPKMCFIKTQCIKNRSNKFKTFTGLALCFILCLPIFMYNLLRKRKSSPYISSIKEVLFARRIISKHLKENDSSITIPFQFYVKFFLACQSLIES